VQCNDLLRVSYANLSQQGQYVHGLLIRLRKHGRPSLV
jgi:hypothetical protein